MDQKLDRRLTVHGVYDMLYWNADSAGVNPEIRKDIKMNDNDHLTNDDVVKIGIGAWIATALLAVALACGFVFLVIALVARFV